MTPVAHREDQPDRQRPTSVERHPGWSALWVAPCRVGLRVKEGEPSDEGRGVTTAVGVVTPDKCAPLRSDVAALRRVGRHGLPPISLPPAGVSRSATVTSTRRSPVIEASAARTCSAT